MDFIAKRYAKLPSEVLARGNTIDLKAAEIAVGYEAYQLTKQKDIADGKTTTKHSQEDLLNMVNAVKNRNKKDESGD